MLPSTRRLMLLQLQQHMPPVRLLLPHWAHLALFSGNAHTIRYALWLILIPTCH